MASAIDQGEVEHEKEQDHRHRADAHIGGRRLQQRWQRRAGRHRNHRRRHGNDREHRAAVGVRGERRCRPGIDREGARSRGAVG